jgi:FkbM family methyltransferase
MAAPVAQRVPALRDLYLRIVRPKYWRINVGNIRSFYRPLVKPGSLVFDIGANRGDYTSAFLHLGARVVAVEPTPQLVEQLRRVSNPRLTVVPCAVGNKPGNLTLTLYADSHLNSLVLDWGETSLPMIEANKVKVGTVQVEVSTLNLLIERYGMPDFIKIDVEGYEPQVLEGLAAFPALLSFEFRVRLMEAAKACISKCPAGSKFNFFWYDARELALETWVDAIAMIDILRTLPRYVFGDILVRQ